MPALTWNIDDLIPPSERFIYNFNSKQELKKWHLYSDSEYGGSLLLYISLQLCKCFIITDAQIKSYHYECLLNAWEVGLGSFHSKSLLENCILQFVLLMKYVLVNLK